MSRRIDEIMNRELLAVLSDTPAQAVRELLRAFAIDSAPVVDEHRPSRDHPERAAMLVDDWRRIDREGAEQLAHGLSRRVGQHGQ